MKHFIFFIHLDILGFERLAKDIEKKKIVKAKKLRIDYIDSVNKKIDVIKKEFSILISNYSGKDDWYIVFKPQNQIFAVDECFRIISELIDIKTGYLIQNYTEVKLEIGIGCAEYQDIDRIDQVRFIAENRTIKLLKTDIIGYYHNWYKEKKKDSLRETFIVITDAVYNLMDPFEKELCQQIGEEALCYSININSLRRKFPLYNFFKIINFYDRIEYRKIQELFVLPLEYNQIKDELKKNKFIFLTGTPEYGKTYTAYNILLDFFNDGNIPEFYRGNTPEERRKMRNDLDDFESLLLKNHIYYFEDPFGLIEYERDEQIERKILTIIDLIKNYESCYVIISSREEVFKEFIEYSMINTNITNLIVELKIKNISYNYEKRKNILANWAKLYNCIWLRNVKLMEFVFKQISNDDVLPSPLSIKNFVIASKNIANETKLRELLILKSEETFVAFAKEIKYMTLDKQLFLLLIYMFNYEYQGLKEEYFKNIINFLIDDYEIPDSLKFEEIQNWFIEDKINIIQGIIFFSHSSYYESIKKLINAKYFFFKKFDNLVQKLLIWKEAASGVASLILRHLDGFPKEYQDLLESMAKSEDLAPALVIALSRHFHSVPKSVINNLLEILLNRNDDIIIRLSNFIYSHYTLNGLNDDLLLRFLKRIEQIGIIPEFISWIFEDKFHELPVKLRNNLLLIMANNMDEDTIGVVHSILKEYRDLIPNRLINQILVILLKIKDWEFLGIEYSLQNYGIINNKVKKILYKIAKRNENENSEFLASDLVENFDNIPKNEREQFIKLLINNLDARYYILKLSLLNFKDLSNDIQEKINQLLVDENNNEFLPWIIFNFAEKLSVNIPKVMTILKNKTYIDDVAWALAFNYKKLTRKDGEEFIKEILIKQPNLWSIMLFLYLNNQSLNSNIRKEIFKFLKKNQSKLTEICKKSKSFELYSENIIDCIDYLINDSCMQFNMQKEYIKYIEKYPEEILSDIPDKLKDLKKNY